MPRQALSARSLKRLSRSAFTGIQGIEEVQERISDIMDNMVGRQVKDLYLRAGTMLADAMRRRVPVRTGLLKSAIFAVAGPETRPNALVGIAFGKAPHGHLVEYGTAGGAKPHPFFRPAITAMKAQIAKTLIEGFRAILAGRGINLPPYTVPTRPPSAPKPKRSRRPRKSP